MAEMIAVLNQDRRGYREYEDIGDTMSKNDETPFWEAADAHLLRYGAAFERVIIERAEGSSLFGFSTSHPVR